MSLRAVKQILDKANKDKKFRDDLLSNPSQTLVGFELSENELLRFKNITPQILLAFSNGIDKRLSKDGSGGSDDDFWVDSVSD